MLFLNPLHDMLRYRRPANSGTERAFIKRFILPLGAKPDGFGNLILRIGNAPILWSSHTDTVHHKDGMQDVIYDAGHYRLPPGSNSNCLGADCTTGVWIMTEMVKANVPGLYVWHRSEECGGLGSIYISEKTPNLLAGINYAIAFDRKDTSSIITHQLNRCASETFALSLAAQLPNFKADSTGIFTDTANYTKLISECTNLSIGYNNAHSAQEIQNAAFPALVLEYMKRLDISKLTAARDPSVIENDWFDESWPPYDREPVNKSLYDLVCDYPNEVADLLEQYGIGADEILANIRIYNQGPPVKRFRSWSMT